MFRFAVLLCLALIVPVPVPSGAEERHLKAEEVLRLRNYELSLQNLTLQIELLSRDLGRIRNEKEAYLQDLYQNYKLDRQYKIDLDKGIWFRDQGVDGAGKPGQ